MVEAARSAWRLAGATLALLAALAGAAWAADAPPAAADPAIEARMMAIAAELRCLVCQNQTIADSHAGLAVDLRQQIREMLAKGMNAPAVLAFQANTSGELSLSTPEGLAAFQAAESQKWGRVIKAAGIQPE